jgi:ankyrin repeat protein
LTASLTDALVGCTAGGGAQHGWTPLLIACKNDHMGVVKLLLARSDVAVNQANTVRGSGGAGRERGQGGLGYRSLCCCCGGGRLTSRLLGVRGGVLGETRLTGTFSSSSSSRYKSAAPFTPRS